MSYCINPLCIDRHNSDDVNQCQACGTGLLLNERYRLVERLQENNNLGTEVWLAKDIEGSDKILKILLGKKKTSTKLFQREAKILAKLNHPGIPKLEYGLCRGPNDFSFSFLVLEYVEGDNLDQWIAQNGPIDQETALAWLKELTQTLHDIHQTKVFHRDIKPSNIILTPQGKLVLIDFGAVREITGTYILKRDQGEYTTNIYSPGGYTPQEQILGHAVLQSDFFALGRTFVYLLTGKRPDDGDLDDVFAISEDGRLTGWRDEVPQLSPSLGDLLDWLMAPLPEQRPRNTGEILRHLKRIDLSAKSSSIPFNVQSRKKEKVNKIPTWQKVVGVTSLLLLLGSSVVKKPLALASNELAMQHHRQGQLKKAQKFYHLAIFLQKEFAQAYYNLAWLYDSNLADPERAIKWYQEAAQWGLAEGHAESARLRILQGDYSGALKSIHQCLKLTKYNAVKASCLKHKAWIRFQQGRFQEAEKDVREAINLEKDSPHAYCLLAQILESQGQPISASQAWETAQKYLNYNVPEEDECLSLANQALK